MSAFVIAQLMTLPIILAMTPFTLAASAFVIAQVMTLAIISAMTALTLSMSTFVVTQVMTSAIVITMTAFTLAAPSAIVTPVDLRGHAMFAVLTDHTLGTGHASHPVITDTLMHGPLRHAALTTASHFSGETPAGL